MIPFPFPLPKHDKLKHLFVGEVIDVVTFIFLLLFYLLSPNSSETIFIFIGIPGIGIGVGKEIYDKVTKTGNAETWDAIFTALPGLIKTIIILTLTI